MAAPIVIEPGPYYEVLKIVAKTDHKCVGSVSLIRKMRIFIKLAWTICTKWALSPGFYALFLWSKGGAQVVLNMEKRVSIVKPVKSKHLVVEVLYHDDTPLEHFIERA